MARRSGVGAALRPHGGRGDGGDLQGAKLAVAEVQRCAGRRGGGDEGDSGAVREGGGGRDGEDPTRGRRGEV